MKSSPQMLPRGEQSATWWACTTGVIALMTCTITGNSAVLVALKRTRRAPAHYPLVSLAAADLLVGLFILPVAGMRELFVFQLHWLLCVSWDGLAVLTCTASILSLCALGWERWCGIIAPFARAKRAKRARLLAWLVWPASVAVAVPTGFIYEPRHHQGDMDKVCPDNMNISFVFVSAFLSFYLPAFVMLVLYARILRALSISPEIRAHKGRSPQDKPPITTNTSCSTLPHKKSLATEIGPMDAIVSRQRRATRTIVGLMGLFLACWTPFFVTMPLDALCDCIQDILWQWFIWLGFANSALNPLVYAAASPSVRRALKNTLPTNTKPTCTSTTTSQTQISHM